MGAVIAAAVIIAAAAERQHGTAQVIIVGISATNALSLVMCGTVQRRYTEGITVTIAFTSDTITTNYLRSKKRKVKYRE